MTTTAFTPITPRGRYGLRQLVRSEAVKITTLRSSLWTALVSVLGVGLVTVLTSRSVLHQPGGFYQGFDPTNQSLAGMLVVVLTVGVFGVLAVTGEYGSGTIRTSLSATPRRGGFVAGKLLVTGVMMLGVAEALSFAAFFAGQAVLSGGGAPHASLGQPGVARAVIMTGAFVTLLGLAAAGLGLVIRHTGGAIAAYVGGTFLLPLLMNHMAHSLMEYMPVQMLSNAVAATVRVPDQVTPTVGLLLMGAYTVVVVAIGATLFRSRDA